MSLSLPTMRIIHLHYFLVQGLCNSALPKQKEKMEKHSHDPIVITTGFYTENDSPTHSQSDKNSCNFNFLVRMGWGTCFWHENVVDISWF